MTIQEAIARENDRRKRAEEARRKSWKEIEEVKFRNPELYKDLYMAFKPHLVRNKG